MSNPLRRLFTTSTLLTARCKEQPIRVNTSERIDVIHYVAKQRITRHNQRNSTIMSLAVHFQHVFFFFYFSMYSELVNRNPSSTLLSVSIVVVFLRLDTINWMSKWHDQFTSVKKPQIQFTPTHFLYGKQYSFKQKASRQGSPVVYWIHQWDFNTRIRHEVNRCKEPFF